MPIYRIAAVRAKNFMRLHDVKIVPNADSTLILIGGENGNGKSSLLRVMSTLLQGKKAQPERPVRIGADQADLEADLDEVDGDGELEVRRTIQPDGESVLEVRDRLGAVKAPQALLDKIIGTRFIDPLTFLELSAKEQRDTLMKLIPDASRIAGLDEKRDRVFRRRTELGRDLDKAEGELARLPDATPGTAIDVAAIAAARAALAENQQAGAKATARKEVAVRAAQDAVARRVANTREIAKLEAQLATLRAEDDVLDADVARCQFDAEAAIAEVDRVSAEWHALAPRRDQLDADLARADAHNRSVFAAESQQKRRSEAAAEVAKLGKEKTELTAVIQTIDDRKAAILSASPLPVDGLAITDVGIELGGVPFDQASDADRLRVALALAIAASPNLADVWIRNGALLGDDRLALVAQLAVAAGKRIWIERVGTRDPGVIEIRDGRIAPLAGDA